MKKYDYLIVGAGLYGAMFAHVMTKRGKSCLVIDKESHVGGYCYSENINGIEVHKYGAHIFRTSNKEVWDFVNSICEFVPFVNSPLACYDGEMYNLPFNMNTFNRLWGVRTPDEAKSYINSHSTKCKNPRNLEEHVKTLVGCDIYEKFIKGYTEKQWGVKCSELPPSVMKRIPIRFTYDNNYYNDVYQGIPINGYTDFISRLLEGSDVILNTNYVDDIEHFNRTAYKVLYTGSVDELCHYCFGRLRYRSVVFKHICNTECDNVQGVAVINYTDKKVPYTRSIEHKHFLKKNVKGSVVSYEYPVPSVEGTTPSYPMSSNDDIMLYNKYKEYIKDTYPNITLGGRLGEYKYYSMNDIIEKIWTKE